MSKNLEYLQIQNIVEEKLAPRLSLNKLTHEVLLDSLPFNVAKFRQEVYSNTGVLIDNDKYIHELVYLEAEKRLISPIQDYLDQCSSNHPNVNYDEVFKDLVKNRLHIDLENEGILEEQYIIKTLIGAVKRVFEPGCQHDTVLVLYSKKQGMYKTSFFRELFGQDFYTSTTLKKFNTDEIMVCLSKWGVELEECEGTIKPHAMSQLKAFITRTTETFRRPYGRSPITVPRTFILVGSTNQPQFLSDPTGNRRFWPVTITKEIDIDWVKNNRDLIWAASVEAYKNGYSTYLSTTEQELSNAINTRKYQLEDVWSEVVTDWALKQEKPFTLSDVFTQVLSIDPRSWRRTDQNRVKSILKSLGFEEPKTASRVNGKTGKYYQPLHLVALQAQLKSNL